jgi:cupredoxin-like protein
MRRRTLSLLALVFALSGCLSDGATTRARRHAVTVTLDDYFIRPQNLSVPGGRTTLTVVNRGRLGHTLRVRINDTVVVAYTAIRPGGSRTRSFHLRRGRYTMFDPIANNEELGMHGTLVVR